MSAAEREITRAETQRRGGWELRRSKYIWREVINLSKDGSEQLLSVSQYDGVRPASEASRSESLKGYKIVEKGDLVINIMLAWMGGLGVSEYDGIVSPAYAVYKPIAPMEPRFLHYLYRTRRYLADFARHSTGVVPSRWRMYSDDFGQVITELPPLPEQKEIVAYLDAETGRIDKAIAAEEKMIALLQERREIVINEAVGGGESRKGWEVKPWNGIFANLDYLRKPITADQRPRANPQYDYYGASGVIDKIDYYNVDDTVLLIAEDGANLVLRNLPLVYKAKGKVWINNHAHILKPRVDNYDFLAYLLESYDYTTLITGSAQPKLSQGQLATIRLAIPLLPEQEEIVKRLDAEMGKIDRAIEVKRRQIELLRERRQIVIDEAVTGKVKVA